MKMSVIVMKNYADLLAMSELTQKDGKTFFCNQRDRAITCMFCRDLQLTSLYFGLLQKGLLIKGEVWRNIFSNVIVVTLVTQCLPSSFLCRNCA